MRVYFVRHGESKFNAQDLHQPNDIELSSSGIKQAQFVAKRFLKISIDTILASDYMRAKQTAEIIAQKIQKEIVFTDLLRERRRPKELLGKKTTSAGSIAIRKLLSQHKHEPEWHYSDEENFFDLKKRANRFLSELSMRKEGNILAVAHGTIIRMITNLMVFGEDFVPNLFERHYHAVVISNTGITLCEMLGKSWKIITWNDHAHLG